MSRREPLVSRLTVSRWFTIAATALALVTAVGITLGVLAITRLADARSLVVDHLDPATTAALRLSNALVNEETGVRGFVLAGEERFLAPYRTGRREERIALAELRRLVPAEDAARVRRDDAIVQARAAAWRRAYAEPAILRVRSRGPGVRRSESLEGQRRFSVVRAALARQQEHLASVRAEARERLRRAARFLSGTFVAIAVLLALSIVGVVLALRFTVSWPLRRVGRQVRRTARGAFDEEIVGAGPRDIVALTRDVDSMRRRIVEELESLREAHERLDAQAQDLQRSNAELEQFAYVASHDLQEPLRKVASFCQLLEQRYEAQLDARGKQYIAFAVDGAKRMQQLINDLLAFSRVGRGANGEQPVVALDDVLRQALTSLAAAIEETGAEIVAAPLPSVRGEPTLLAAVFQNLIGNALKFHGEERPRVEVGVERDGAEWRFRCTDNGIGIEPDYAERIFMIFQRLHPKDVYAGTGIGLALCRKIVEHHGGRVWLDTESAGGTTFRFTLPALEETA